MIVDGVLFDTVGVTATITQLVPVEAGRDVVLSQPTPMLIGITPFSQDMQYATAHASASFGGTDPEIVMPPQVYDGPEAHMRWFPKGEPLTVQDTIVLKAIQDSGGNQDLNAILCIAYGIGTSKPRSECPSPRGRIITKGGNLTANAWTVVNTLRQDLKPNKKYAIVGALAHSAAARAVRFLHPDFMGRTPTLRAHVDVDDGFEFFDLCPVFSGDTNLTIEGYTSGAEDMTVIVLLAEL